MSGYYRKRKVWNRGKLKKRPFSEGEKELISKVYGSRLNVDDIVISNEVNYSNKGVVSVAFYDHSVKTMGLGKFNDKFSSIDKIADELGDNKEFKEASLVNRAFFMKYTTDGSDPVTNPTAIAAVSGDIVTFGAGGGPLKAYAFKAAMSDSNAISENFYAETEANNGTGSANTIAFHSWYYSTTSVGDIDYSETGVSHLIVWKIEMGDYPVGATFDVILETTDAVPVEVFNVSLGGGADVHTYDLNALGFPTALYRIKVVQTAGPAGDYKIRITNN